jgi:hypothetical protein
MSIPNLESEREVGMDNERTMYRLVNVPADVNIQWSGVRPVPAIGTRVRVTMNDLGPGVITGYFVEYGWLGVYVRLDPDTRPAWHKKQNPTKTDAMVFGIEIQLI